MGRIQDQNEVQAFFSNGLDPPFNMGIGTWCLVRGVNDVETLGLEDGVYGACELAVIVVNQDL